MDIQNAFASERPSEVTFAARVTSAPWFFYGRTTRCEHESFYARTASGPVRIVDNVGIAPPVPVHPGDMIEVRGELVPKSGAAPVVHWTHHDPGGRHEDGFIRFRGRLYA